MGHAGGLLGWARTSGATLRQGVAAPLLSRDPDPVAGHPAPSVADVSASTTGLALRRADGSPHPRCLRRQSLLPSPALYREPCDLVCSAGNAGPLAWPDRQRG